MIIPYEQLSADALSGVIENFITREGTDYGDVEWSLAQKVAQVKQQIVAGEVVVVFDEATETVSLMLRRELPRDV